MPGMDEEQLDAIDVIVDQWRHERPDLDLSPLGIFGRLMRLSMLLGTDVERWCAQHGLRNGEFDVLTALRRCGPPFAQTPSELAGALMMSRAGMTKRLDRLESAGLVERSLDAADRRSFRIALSARGREVIDAALTEHAANLARLTAELSIEQRTGLEQSLRVLLSATGRP
jgi:DNA-binding MarR family transcriptional regulator